VITREQSICLCQRGERCEQRREERALIIITRMLYLRRIIVSDRAAISSALLMIFIDYAGFSHYCCHYCLLFLSLLPGFSLLRFIYLFRWCHAAVTLSCRCIYCRHCCRLRHFRFLLMLIFRWCRWYFWLRYAEMRGYCWRAAIASSPFLAPPILSLLFFASDAVIFIFDAMRRRFRMMLMIFHFARYFDCFAIYRRCLLPRRLFRRCYYADAAVIVYYARCWCLFFAMPFPAPPMPSAFFATPIWYFSLFSRFFVTLYYCWCDASHSRPDDILLPFIATMPFSLMMMPPFSARRLIAVSLRHTRDARHYFSLMFFWHFRFFSPIIMRQCSPLIAAAAATTSAFSCLVPRRCCLVVLFAFSCFLDATPADWRSRCLRLFTIAYSSRHYFIIAGWYAFIIMRASAMLLTRCHARYCRHACHYWCYAGYCFYCHALRLSLIDVSLLSCCWCHDYISMRYAAWVSRFSCRQSRLLLFLLRFFYCCAIQWCRRLIYLIYAYWRQFIFAKTLFHFLRADAIMRPLFPRHIYASFLFILHFHFAITMLRRFIDAADDTPLWCRRFLFAGVFRRARSAFLSALRLKMNAMMSAIAFCFMHIKKAAMLLPFAILRHFAIYLHWLASLQRLVIWYRHVFVTSRFHTAIATAGLQAYYISMSFSFHTPSAISFHTLFHLRLMMNYFRFMMPLDYLMPLILIFIYFSYAAEIFLHVTPLSSCRHYFTIISCCDAALYFTPLFRRLFAFRLSAYALHYYFACL